MNVQENNTQMQRQDWDGKIFNGAWSTAAGGTARVMEPATGETLADVGIASAEDVDRSARQALKAQAAWAETPFDQRAAVLREAARLLQDQVETFHYWNQRECGSIKPKSEWEMHATYEQILMAAAMPMQPDGMTFPSSMPGRTNLWRRIPIGTVGVIAPWNFPVLLSMRSVAPALAMGNAVILKPDQHSAVTGGLLIAKVFAEAGLPEGLLHVLPGGPNTGEAVVEHPDVHMISFTGSTTVGRKIGAACGASLKKTALELGGNNAMIILDDADLESASSNGAWGAYLHQGQICMQAGRHLVHRSVAEAYTEKLAERARNLYAGNPFPGPIHLGPLINNTQLARVHKIVQDSIAAGAVATEGGTHQDLFYAATVLTGVTPDMPAFSEEIFGPVAPITVFDTDEEAVALANSSAYGLSAGIHSASVSRAMGIAKRLKTGMVHINDQTVNNEFHVPFGGMGASGDGGRFGGPANVDQFTQTQWISSMEAGIVYPF